MGTTRVLNERLKIVKNLGIPRASDYQLCKCLLESDGEDHEKINEFVKQIKQWPLGETKLPCWMERLILNLLSETNLQD